MLLVKNLFSEVNTTITHDTIICLHTYLHIIHDRIQHASLLQNKN